MEWHPFVELLIWPFNQQVVRVIPFARIVSEGGGFEISAAIFKRLCRASPRGAVWCLLLAGAIMLLMCALLTTGAQGATADTLGVSLSTSSPATGVPFTMTFTGTDTPFNERGNTPVLYAVVRRANGVACQTTFGQDQQVAGTDNASVVYNQYTRPNPVSDRSFTYPVTFTPVAGSYLVCAWLETDGSDEKGKGDVASEVVTASATTNYVSVNTDTLGVSLDVESGDRRAVHDDVHWD